MLASFNINFPFSGITLHYKLQYMKKILLSVSILFFFATAMAQIENPVKWTFSSKRIKGDKDKYELHMTAVLDKKWHIYAQDAGDGPEPTSFSFDKNPLFKIDEKVAEIGTLEKQYDPNFRSTLKFYSGKVDFVQKIKMKAQVKTMAKGKITYMVCNDKKCLPPKSVPFSIKIDPKA